MKRILLAMLHFICVPTIAVRAAGADALLIAQHSLLIALLATPACAAGPDADAYLGSGKFDEGAAALEAHLKTQPKDDEVRFGLAWIQFVQAIQRLGQDLVAYGPRTYGNKELADVVGEIPAPAELLTHPRLRRIIQQWLDNLARVDGTLAQMTSDDQEWIPCPKPRGAIGLPVTQEMVDQWNVALNETESILQGKKLLPFWRGTKARGLNLRKAFLEPRTLDVILWIQGTAAAPYLEEGELTQPDTWEKIDQAFRGQFLSFGLWFN
jgi:hypothetical protein